MPHSPNNSNKKRPNSFLRYSGMAGQMIAIIVLFTLGGLELDERLNTKTPYFTGGLTVIGVILAMYFAVKDLLKK